MSRRMLAIVCCVGLSGAPGFAGDRAANGGDRDTTSSSTSSASRDASTADLKGIPKTHRYWWAIAGGTALGGGIGALFPSHATSFGKGALIGGGAASMFYLATHKREAGAWRPWAWVATNAILLGGLGWTVCNCGGGFPVGAAIGGGFTAAVQAFQPRHHKTLATYTGADTQQQQPPPQQTAPPPNQPQANPPQQPPPQTAPQTNPPPDAPEPEDRP